VAKVKPAFPFAPAVTPVREVSVTEVGFSFAVPALPDHLIARLPGVEDGTPEKIVLHRFVAIDHEPFAFPLNVGEVTLLPEALHPARLSLAFTTTDDPPPVLRPGANLSDPVIELQDTVPVALTAGEPANALPPLDAIAVTTGNTTARTAMATIRRETDIGFLPSVQLGAIDVVGFPPSADSLCVTMARTPPRVNQPEYCSQLLLHKFLQHLLHEFCGPTLSESLSFAPPP
jgi:hypothetical protein